MAIPPEYSPHRETWMAYPWDTRIWGRKLRAAQETISNLVRIGSLFKPVCLLVPHRLEKTLAKGFPKSEVTPIPAYYNDIWLLDTYAAIHKNGI